MRYCLVFIFLYGCLGEGEGTDIELTCNTTITVNITPDELATLRSEGEAFISSLGETVEASEVVSFDITQNNTSAIEVCSVEDNDTETDTNTSTVATNTNINGETEEGVE